MNEVIWEQLDVCGVVSTVASWYCAEMPVPDRTGLKIVDIDVKDVRFPTSLGGHGSDALVNT